ncbi:MAG: hypothetical protein LLF96_05425 [Eubacteriales bacterium]|nr:hypothetical protein [Eubacteriales bacterium]
MGNTFEHLLGLSAKNALALLASYGITNVRVTLTGAPPMGEHLIPACPAPRPERISALASIGAQFAVGEDEEEDAVAFNPLTDPSLDDGMLVESRVVAVRDDGRQLLVARFHVGDPKPGLCEKPG